MKLKQVIVSVLCMIYPCHNAVGAYYTFDGGEPSELQITFLDSSYVYVDRPFYSSYDKLVHTKWANLYVDSGGSEVYPSREYNLEWLNGQVTFDLPRNCRIAERWRAIFWTDGSTTGRRSDTVTSADSTIKYHKEPANILAHSTTWQFSIPKLECSDTSEQYINVSWSAFFNAQKWWDGKGNQTTGRLVLVEIYLMPGKHRTSTSSFQSVLFT
ncbi:hypothetical protein D3G64_25765 [Escherichia coli]|nr:hypothetical protein [Escherichia coli]